MSNVRKFPEKVFRKTTPSEGGEIRRTADSETHVAKPHFALGYVAHYAGKCPVSGKHLSVWACEPRETGYSAISFSG